MKLKISALLIFIFLITKCVYTQTIKDENPATAEPISFKNGNVTLKGTLYLPKTAGKHPAIVAYHSANGPTRDFPFYKHLTRDLPAKGFAVLLFDRRGSGESEGVFETADFKDLAGDGIAGIEYLKNRKEIDARKIGVWGVSQGGWIAPLATTMSKDISFLVIVSGPGVSPAEQMKYGAAYSLREAKYSDSVVEEVMQLRGLLDAFYRGKESGEKVQQAIGKARVQPWFNLAYLPSGGNLPEKPKTTKWFQEMDFNPLPTLSKVKIPMLVLFGETDRWVPIEKSIENIKEATKDNKNVTIQRITGADHLMMIKASDSEKVVSTEYIETLLNWLQQRK